MNEKRNLKAHPGAHVLLSTLLFCGAAFAYTSHMPEFGRFFTGANDFLPLYTSARLAGTDRMYDVAEGLKEQERVAGYHIVGAYHNRFPWQALLMAPLGRLPYRMAYWIWIGVNLACFAALVRFWLLPRDYVLWGAVYFPAAASIIVGQDGLMLALCSALALNAVRRGHDKTAGLLFALCTAKPHLFLLVPAALALKGRWRIIWSAAAGTAALLAVGTIFAGPQWFSRWIKIVRLLGGSSAADVQRRPTVFQFGMSEATVIAALLLAGAFLIVIRRTQTTEAALGTAMIGSILIAPHSAVYDLPLLLVAILALPLERGSRWLRLVLLTPIPYWALLSGAPWSIALPLMLLGALAAVVWAQGPVKRVVSSALG